MAFTPSSGGQPNATVATLTFSPYGGTNGGAAMLGGIELSAGGNTLYQATINGYNPNGQIAGQTVTRTNVDNSLSTDSLGYTYGTGPTDNTSDANSLTQVTHTDGTTTENYDYDGVGNFEDSPLGSVNDLNQYSSRTEDLRGNVLDDGTYAYTYDANNRLISVTPHDNTQSRLTFGYDLQGRRIWKDVYTWDAVGRQWAYAYSRTYVYDGTQLVGELDQAGKLLTGYTWSPSGQLLAATDYTQATPKTYVAVVDASGNTAMLVDPVAGTVAASYTYDSYGNLLSATGPARSVCSILGKGLYYDAEAPSIGHAGQRDDHLNIWLERDKAGELAGGVNLYQFLGGDPINLSDTSGLAPTSVQRFLDRAAEKLASLPAYVAGQGPGADVPTRIALDSINAGAGVLDNAAARYQPALAVGGRSDLVANGVAGALRGAVNTVDERVIVGEVVGYANAGLDARTTAVLVVGQRTPFVASVIAGTELQSGLSFHAADFGASLGPSQAGQRFITIGSDAAAAVFAFGDIGFATDVNAEPITIGRFTGKIPSRRVLLQGNFRSGHVINPFSRSAGITPAVEEELAAGGLTERTPQQVGIVAPPDHHIFPQEERAWFKARGVNVDLYTITLDQATHGAVHYGGGPGLGGGWWNETIMQNLYNQEANARRMLTPDEIFAEGRRMLKQAKLDHLPIHPWNSTK